jgi:ketosteroid isomerase-like protein
MDSLAEDIKWHVSGQSPLAGKYVGKGEVLGFFGKMMNLYEGSLKLDVLDILASDRHGVVLTREAAQYDGRSVEFRSVHLWEISGGKLKQFHVFYDDAYHQS